MYRVALFALVLFGCVWASGSDDLGNVFLGWILAACAGLTLTEKAYRPMVGSSDDVKDA